MRGLVADDVSEQVGQIANIAGTAVRGLEIENGVDAVAGKIADYPAERVLAGFAT